MLTLSDGRNELWQWDTNRKLTVDADCSQVHFSNKVFGRSIDVDVVDGVAVIPDILLQTDKDLNAWAFVGTPENGYTKISKVFKVNRKNKPADYVFTPTEQTTLGEILKRLDDIESAQDPDAIKNAVDDYLTNNPIKVEETDPTVPDWAKQSTKPSYTKSEVGLGNVDDVKQYSASNPPPYPVTSVNNKTGDVTIDIPTKVSAFTNDAGYLTQHQDISGKLDASELPEAINDALAQAKASGEFDGADGQDGITPHIGDNGNWFIGDTDTGNPSRGIQGEPGKDGEDGAKGDKGDPGEKGEPGEKGDKGDKGDTGAQGIQGEKGEPGAKGETGEKGDKGDKGDTGETGEAGYTPARGTDYWTSADQTAIVNATLAALPTWTGGSY